MRCLCLHRAACTYSPIHAVSGARTASPRAGAQFLSPHSVAQTHTSLNSVVPLSHRAETRRDETTTPAGQRSAITPFHSLQCLQIRRSGVLPSC
jgi:hypothetical protein